MRVIGVAALVLLGVCFLFLVIVALRGLAASQKHAEDLGYKRKGLFLDRPPEDSMAPWVLAERERKYNRWRKPKD